MTITTSDHSDDTPPQSAEEKQTRRAKHRRRAIRAQQQDAEARYHANERRAMVIGVLALLFLIAMIAFLSML